MPDQDFIPARDGAALVHLGTYRRVLPVALERLYENVLDWEHLPHVHRSEFADVRCLEAGPGGWRAALTDGAGRIATVEVSLDRQRRRWITRTIDGHGAGSAVWTHAFPESPRRVDVVVDFFVTAAPEVLRRRLGEAFAGRYRRLYDQDVAMMVERQRQLDRRLERAPASDRVLTLGQRADLELPLEIVVGGREFVLAEVEGVLTAWPRQCPHQLGPLGTDALEGREVVCRWHGDRFDALTGENLSGRACRLEHRPRIEIDPSGSVVVTATH
ncbi:MAG TPA: Rieske (2Fe-2S) protein [Pseudomonadales bacterium]